MKKIIILGKNSYIGSSLKEYLCRFTDKYCVDVISTNGLKPDQSHFLSYNVAVCVAGVAHIKETQKNRELYYRINRDLVIEMARSAKNAGVKQFVLLSSMSVYGLTFGYITKNSIPHPVNAYGESKLQADEEIRKIENEKFIFTCLRPPMVYGKNCKGNYQVLRNIALWSPFFPDYKNKKSMIYIGNLCEFIKNSIDFELNGIFFPQNSEYVNTSEMVRLIAESHKKNIIFTKKLNRLIDNSQITFINKAFGNLMYGKDDTIDKYNFKESILMTEG